MSLEDGCPVCNSSRSAKETFATAKVAEHIHEKARHDDRRNARIDDRTDDGSLAEIRAALRERE